MDKNSWYTPEKYIKSVSCVLGEIELDPFSCRNANKVVQAKRYYTKDDNALDRDWTGSIFMNPPYGRGIMDKSIEKLIEQYSRLNFNNAVVLVNSATDTKWFHKVVDYSKALCFTNHRISFYNDDGKNISNNTKGQIFILINRSGDLLNKFNEEFKQYGLVLKNESAK